jgi:hypothetical protein
MCPLGGDLHIALQDATGDNLGIFVCASGRSRFSMADKSSTGILSSDQSCDRATLNNSCLVSESVM